MSIIGFRNLVLILSDILGGFGCGYAGFPCRSGRRLRTCPRRALGGFLPPTSAGLQITLPRGLTSGATRGPLQVCFV